LTVPANGEGYAALVAFADRHERLRAWAIEGCNGYGAGLVRVLRQRDEWVIEMDRPHRPARRRGAKSDELDAVRAAREALHRDFVGEPRRGGDALMVRLTARRSAVHAATKAKQQLRALVITAPEALRAKLHGKSTEQMIKLCARLRTNPKTDLATQHSVITLRCLARRIGALQAEIDAHQGAIRELVHGWRADLLDQPGVGPIVAAIVLCAWSHQARFRNEAAFAMLAGTAPIPASSGQTVRHRLNRSGDRQLNCAIHTIMLSRLRHDPVTRDYVNRRSKEGKTDREIRRCLKRYITRQLYRQLEHQPLDTP
jgi:transposase